MRQALFVIAVMGIILASATPSFSKDTAKDFAKASNLFGFSMLNEIARKSPKDNIVLSPLSIDLALLMTWNGSAGVTEKEMAKTLRISDISREGANRGIRAWTAQLTKADPLTQLNLANSLWINERYHVNPHFIAENKEELQAEVHTLNFLNAVDAAHRINTWVDQQTNHHIPTIVSPQQVHGAEMALINAVYFNGKWTHPFQTDDTQKAVFTPSDQSKIHVMMMKKQGVMEYGDNSKAQIAVLPYGNGNTEAVIILPNPAQSAKEFLSKLSFAEFNEWLTQCKMRPGVLELPRVKASYSITLNQLLEKMGMRSAFIGSEADFSRMSAEDRRDLFISLVLHKAQLDIGEKGTEASAATAVIMLRSAIMLPPKNAFRMIVDHPFLFCIREKTTGTILFIAWIENPLQNG
jgi:serine protease inhibitor